MTVQLHKKKVSVTITSRAYNVCYNVPNVGEIEGEVTVLPESEYPIETEDPLNQISMGVTDRFYFPTNFIDVDFNKNPKLAGLKDRILGKLTLPDNVPVQLKPESNYQSESIFQTRSKEYRACVNACYSILEEIAREESKGK